MAWLLQLGFPRRRNADPVPYFQHVVLVPLPALRHGDYAVRRPVHQPTRLPRAGLGNPRRRVLQLLDPAGTPLAVVLLFAAAFLCSPVIGASNLFYQRNILNGILNCAILYFLFRLCFEKYYGTGEEAGFRPLLALAGLLLFSQILRKDNIAILVAAVAVLFLFRIARPRRLIPIGVLLCLGVVLGNGPMERAVIGADTQPKALYLDSLAEPHGRAACPELLDPDSPADQETIARILDPTVYKKEWIPTEVPYYWSFCAGRDYTDVDIRNFRNLLFRAACQNPGIFLGQRAELFFMILGGPQHSTVDLDHGWEPAWFQKVWRDYSLWHRQVASAGLGKLQRGAIHRTLQLDACLCAWSGIRSLIFSSFSLPSCCTSGCR